jgi:AcrR family transcriptional regulator
MLMSRKYELKKRAAKQEKTRQRIVEALVELHEEVGPANTSIKAVAERAGVQRLTVYRHFSDLLEMFHACSAHFLAQNPPPDPENWLAVEDPVDQLKHGLSDLYAYYARTERMTSNILRDAPDIPEVAAVAEPVFKGIMQYGTILSQSWDVPDDRRRLLQSAINHAIWFETWRSMRRVQGLSNEEAVELMTAMVIGASQ